MPHSGRFYGPRLLAAARLPLAHLRLGEDPLVDLIAAALPEAGVPVLRALHPRVWLDLNREPWEFDPELFAEPLPDYMNARSPRVAVGLGTIMRVIGPGVEIWRDRLALAEGMARVAAVHRPYHAALRALIDETRARFGVAVLLDLHSMPDAIAFAESGRRVDVALGDGYGRAAGAFVIETALPLLEAAGLAVGRNLPYAGGYITRHYGRPERAIHALQVELRRGTHLAGDGLSPGPGMPGLADLLADLAQALARAAAPHRRRP